MLVRRLVRFGIFVGVVLAMWTFAQPVHASPAPFGPFCDDRGASAIAEPPTLQAPEGPEAVLHRAAVPCNRGEMTRSASVVPARARAAVRIGLAMHAIPTVALALARLRSVRLAVPATTGTPPRGVGSRIERPPRS